MLRGSAAKRYAQALAQIAQAQHAWDAWARELGTIERILSNPLLRQYLRNPRISAAEKVETVRQVAEGQLSPEAMNLVRMLVERGHAELAPQLLTWFARLADEAQGVLRVQVTTAVPLSEDERAQLTRRLGGTAGRRVRLAEQVDRLIIGGLILRIGDELIDNSLRTRLVALRSTLVRG